MLIDSQVSQDRDVAILIDATLDDTDRANATKVANRLLKMAKDRWRVALVLSGEHAECKRAPSGSTDGDSFGSPLFDVKVYPFAIATGDDTQHARWLKRELAHVRNRYMDSALECALRAACNLDWQPEVPRHLFIMGFSLPHQDSDSGLLLRTGVNCPKDVRWRTQLHRLQSQRVLMRAAVPPLTSDLQRQFPTSFLGLIHREIWSELNGRREPSLLDAGLSDRWTSDFLV